MGVVQAGRNGSQRILLVALCVGHRCAGLHALSAEGSAAQQHCLPAPAEPAGSAEVLAEAEAEAGPGGVTGTRELVRAAVRVRSHAVLVNVPCLNMCSEGAIILGGEAVSDSNGMRWLGLPRRFTVADRVPQAQDIVEWIARAALGATSQPPSKPRH